MNQDSNKKENNSKNKASIQDPSSSKSQETAQSETLNSNQKKEVSKPVSDSAQKEKAKASFVKLNSLYAFKMGMSQVYDDQNKMIPVTVLKYKPLKISQIKTKKKDGYSAVQVVMESSKKINKSQAGHLKKSKIKSSNFAREIRQDLPEGICLGQEISIESFQQGDQVQISATSKGHGYAGVVKRWGFGGGPASHGAEKHRTTGSIANTATQGRVFPGKKMPGHFGVEKTTIKNVRVVDILPSKQAILIHGPAPGAVGSCIELTKQGSSNANTN